MLRLGFVHSPSKPTMFVHYECAWKVKEKYPVIAPECKVVFEMLPVPKSHEHLRNHVLDSGEHDVLALSFEKSWLLGTSCCNGLRK